MRSIDAEGVAVGLFFGLVFAAGHLNQEVRDHPADRSAGTRTSAVTYGPRRTFAMSLALFSVAYGLLVAFAVAGVVPRILLLTLAVWVLHVHWSLRVLREGVGVETALWMQRRYRLLFGVVGLLMVLR